MNNEIWKEFSTGYKISNSGNTKSKNKNLKQYNKGNFLRIDTTEKYPKKSYYIHRLVAEYFVINPDKTKYTMVNHIDMDKHNNVYTNLEWVQKHEYFKLNKKNIIPINPKCNNKPFYQFGLDGSFIKKWDNFEFFKKENPTYTIRYITNCLNNKSKTSYDYIWSYSEICNIKKVINQNEMWKPIKDHNKYEISSLSNVRSNAKLLKQNINGGYYNVNINNKTYRVHRLVALAFIENDDIINKTYVDHEC